MIANDQAIADFIKATWPKIRSISSSHIADTDYNSDARKQGERDGKKIAKEVQKFIESDDVQRNLAKARKFAEQKFQAAKKEVEKFVRDEGKFAVRAVTTKKKRRR